MDKTIVTVGVVLVGLGVGFYSAFQLMPELHSAYLIGGCLWGILGAITIGLGLKKRDRLGARKVF